MRHLFTSLLILIFCAGYSQMIVDVTSYGAVGDSATENTTFIQNAIDSVTAHGGGTVLIDNGVYTTSTIILKSNVTLRITPGTKLKSIKDIASLPMITYNTPSWTTVDYTSQSMIFAEDASNIRITGGGTIDGFGGYDNIGNLLGISNKNMRPFGLRFHNITGLVLDSIYLMESPQWMGHIAGCANVHINAIDIYNQGTGSNDGIDIDACRNVLVENSNFDTNDDCLPVKTHSLDTCRDVLIRNCTMASYERPVKVGNESLGPIINVRFENITVKASTFSAGGNLQPYNAIYVAIADGGSADSIVFDNIQVNTPYKCAIFARLCERNNHWDPNAPNPPVQYLRNVWINNVNCTQLTNYPSSITGIPGYDLQNIYLKNIHITVPGNGPVGSSNLSEHLSTRPEYDIWSDSLPAYGLFMWHVNGIFLDSFCVDTQKYDQRPYYYCMDTANIPNLSPCSNYDVNIPPDFNITFPPTAVNAVEPDKEITVYPNPAKDVVVVNNLPEQAELVAIYTITGDRVAIVPTLGRSQSVINTNDLAGGVYILTVMGSHYSLNRKLVVTR